MSSLASWQVVVAGIFVTVHVLSWTICALGRPYSRARPLVLRLFKLGTYGPLSMLTMLVIWGVVSRVTLPAGGIKLAMGLALLSIPSMVVLALIDWRRGGPEAASGQEEQI
ncbi:MAG: hypothetical protein ISP10_01820 [Aeromicrobium sp.]|jgi:hypothetical protein|nr:hypothetical protein [Aeromicrobium sp.]